MNDILGGVVFGLLACVFAAIILYMQRWSDRPIVARDANVIGGFIEHYCAKTKIDIDQVVLVAHEMDGMTVFHIKSIDLFPEIWLNE